MLVDVTAPAGTCHRIWKQSHADKKTFHCQAKRTQRALKKRGLYSGGIVGINQLVRPI